eukprot:GEMP01048150.1.p1 GENE.GEMP01048150.1~~GEMP01048150.1.p1  ORF type:complete len:219 (+),score=28.07 GEMP01048150.1:95-751(+)
MRGLYADHVIFLHYGFLWKQNKIDFYLLHWPGVPGHDGDKAVHREKRLEAWKAMEELHAKGTVKTIGVSNFSINHLEDLLSNCTVPPMMNQIEIHPLWPSNLPEVIEFHRRHGIILQAYSPLGAGTAVTEGDTNGTQVLLSHPAVQSVATETGRTPAQVLLRYLVQQGICVCFRTTRRERLKDNIDVFDWALSSIQMERLQAMSADGQKFCWNPSRIR